MALGHSEVVEFEDAETDAKWRVSFDAQMPAWEFNFNGATVFYIYDDQFETPALCTMFVDFMINRLRRWP